MSETLPSLDDFTESELPSVEELITEDKLPSVEEFIEEEKEEKIVEEDNNTITLEDAEGNAQIEITDVIQAPEWGDLV